MPVTIYTFLAIYAGALFILVSLILVRAPFMHPVYSSFFFSCSCFFCCSWSAISKSWTSIFPSLFRSGMLVSGGEGGTGADAGLTATAATAQRFAVLV